MEEVAIHVQYIFPLSFYIPPFHQENHIWYVYIFDHAFVTPPLTRGILKHPGQTLGNLHVKPCESPRDGVPTPPSLTRGERNWNRNDRRVVEFCVLRCSFTSTSISCRLQRHLTWSVTHEEYTSYTGLRLQLITHRPRRPTSQRLPVEI